MVALPLAIPQGQIVFGASEAPFFFDPIIQPARHGATGRPSYLSCAEPLDGHILETPVKQNCLTFQAENTGFMLFRERARNLFNKETS